MRRSRITSLVTAALVSGLAWTSLPAVAAASTVPVVPSALPTGPALQVASIDPASHVLARPGEAPVTVLPDGGWADTLFRVRGGYLVSLRWGVSKHRLVVVADDGSQRVVRNTWTYSPISVANDGRSFIGVQHRVHRRGVSEAYVVRRFRVQDGRAVGKPLVRPFRDLEPRALAVTPTTVTLISPHRVGRRDVEKRTELWSTRTGRTRLISRHLNTFDDAPRVWAGSTGAHVVGVDRGQHQVALDSLTRKPLWRTRNDESLQSFAPDSRTVLTASGDLTLGGSDYVDGVRGLSVRNARTGELLADFTGYFAFATDLLPSTTGLAWESADSFVVHAYDGVTHVEEDSWYNGGGQVRCTVSTASCERISDAIVVPVVGPSH